MRKIAQFGALKWLKKELYSSILLARVELELAQANFNTAALGKFELIISEVSNNLAVANDEVGSILCVELCQLAKYLRLDDKSEQANNSVSDLMQGLLLLNDHIEEASNGSDVDSRSIGVIIDVMRERRGELAIQKSSLFMLDLSGAAVSSDNVSSELGQLAGSARPEFQHFLLNYFQGRRKKHSFQKLQDLLVTLVECSSIELVKEYLTATHIVLGGLKDEVLVDDGVFMALMGPFERQLKKLSILGEQKTAMALPLSLLRQTLYYVAKMPSEGEAAILQEKYDLESRLVGEVDSLHYGQALSSIASTVRGEFKQVKQWLEGIFDYGKPPVVEIDTFIESAEGWSEMLSVVGENKLSQDLAIFIRNFAFCIYSTPEPEESRLMALAEEWFRIDEDLIDLEKRVPVDNMNVETEEKESENPLIISTAQTTLEDINIIKEIVLGEGRKDTPWEKVENLLKHVQAACYFIELNGSAELIEKERCFLKAVVENEHYYTNDEEVCAIADIISSVEYLLESLIDGIQVVGIDLSLADKAAAFLEGRVDYVHDFLPDQNAPVKETEDASDLGDSNNDKLDIEPLLLDEELDEQELNEQELILQTFIEEAEDISVSLKDDFNHWETDLDNEEPLKNIRRAFHTLKGSGRLAKVDFISETAWAVEELLNDIIDKDLQLNNDVVNLVYEYVKALPAWVGKINGDRPSLDDVGSLIESADAIRSKILSETMIACDEREKAAPPSELCAIFSTESSGHLTTIKAFIEQQAELSESSVTEELFRSAHTIHGSALMADIKIVENLSHVLCDYVSRLYAENIVCDREDLCSLLTQYCDITDQQLEYLNGQRASEPEYQPLYELIKQRLENIPSSLANAYTLEEDEEVEEVIDGSLVGSEQNIASEAKLDISDIVKEQGYEREHDALTQASMDEMCAVFIDEGTELLENLSEQLTVWQVGVGDSENIEKVQHILHTLKGSSILVGLDEFGSVIHEVESLFDESQKTPEGISSDLLARVLAVSDELLIGLQDENVTANGAEFTALVEKLTESQKNDDDIPNEVGDVTQAQEDTDKVALQARPQSRIDSNAGLQDKKVRISNTLLDSFITDVGEVNVAQGLLSQKYKDRQYQIKELSQTIARLREQLRRLEIETEAQVLFKVDESQASIDFDPLELDRYSLMQQLSRSLLETVSDLENVRDSLLKADDEMSVLIDKESSLTDILLEDLLRTRMIEFIRFQPRFERLVRQLDGELNKPTKLVLQGGETEIDRSILDTLQVPIEHIIRNSMAHGVEEAAERDQLKKSREASITLQLSRKQSEIHLVISDDGRGLDVKKIRSKAIKLGYIKESEGYSDQDLAQFILRPGFSTIEEVSTLAGRGIGMDIVNDTLRSIGGALTIHSEAGKGTSFHLIFPYTMAINIALMIETNQTLYAIPNNFINSVVRVPSELIIDSFNEDKPVLVQEGKEYQLHNLAQLLGLRHEEGNREHDRWAYVLLVDSREKKHAVVVDKIVGNKEVVVKPLGLHLDVIPWLSGSTVFNDGEIVLMLDLPILAEMGEVGISKEQQENRIQEVLAPLVMVVDDSVTFRRVASRLLMQNGYRVIEARDGVEAIEKLENIKPDLFLLDVEMPRMDGFELARYIRETDAISERPIVMVTSRIGVKHQDYAEDIGINEYFGKPFDNKALVTSIGELLEGSRANAG